MELAGPGCVTPALGQTVADGLPSFFLLQSLNANKEAESGKAIVKVTLETQGMMASLLSTCNVLTSHQERRWYRCSGICGGRSGWQGANMPGWSL